MCPVRTQRGERGRRSSPVGSSAKRKWPLAGPFLCRALVVMMTMLDDHHFVGVATMAPAFVAAAGNVPGEPEENSEQLFSNGEYARQKQALFLPALVLWRSWLAVGGEFAVSNGVLVVLVAIIHRAHGAVGLHRKSILAGLFELRKEDAQIQHAIPGNVGGDHFAFIRGVAEVAPVHNPVTRRYLIGKHRAFAPVGSKRTVKRPGPNQSPCARRLGHRLRGRLEREREGEKNRQRQSAKRPVQVSRPASFEMSDDRNLAFRFGRKYADARHRSACGKPAPDASSTHKNVIWGDAMSALSRRNFLALAGSTAAAALSGRFTTFADAAMGPTDKFDLVIKGGDVLDPSQSLRGKRDIGIRWGMIEAIEADIPAARALKSIDASGKLVTPGLIDLHSHVYPYGSAIGIPADELAQFQCTTTMVSAGDAGVNNLAALRRYIVAQSRTRIYAFVHIANNGLSAFPVAELYNIDNAQMEACAMALAENPDFLLGVKVRMSENVIFKHALEPLKRAIQACEMCGWPAKMMVHIGGVETKELMSQILDLLRPGDVLTHCYSGAPNIAGAFTNIVQDGKLLPAALAAKQRGVIFDVGHGGGSFDFPVAGVAIPGGCAPDTISSDIHVFSGNTPGMPYLPWVMSKFLTLGFSLEQVVAMATTAPAKIINRAPKIGTLQIGAPGDVAIMELVEAPVTFVDTRNNKREGKLLLKPVQTVINGVPFGRPYQAPFAVR